MEESYSARIVYLLEEELRNVYENMFGWIKTMDLMKEIERFICSSCKEVFLIKNSIDCIKCNRIYCKTCICSYCNKKV